MTRLKKIKLEHFRSFEYFEYTFPEKGLIGLRGVSGAGKSSIFLAISYALGYCPHSKDKLACWWSDKSARVVLTLDLNGSELVVDRSEKLHISKDGVPLEGSNKLLNEELEKLLAINPELLQVLTYRKQRSNGLFLSLTDSTKKEFLSNILGLEEIELVVKRAKKQVDGLEDELKSLNERASIYKEQLANFKWPEGISRFIDTYGYATERANLDRGLAYNRKLIDDLFRKRNEVENAISSDIAEAKDRESRILNKIVKRADYKAKSLILLKEKLSNDSVFVKNLELKHGMDLYVLNKDAQLLSKKTADVGLLEKALEKNQAEQDKIRVELGKLAYELCPTCEREWHNEATSSYITTLTDRISDLVKSEKELINNINDNGESLFKLNDLQKRIKEFQIPELDIRKNQLNKLNNEVIAKEAQIGLWCNNKRGKVNLASKNTIDSITRRWFKTSVEPLEKELERIRVTVREAELKSERLNVLKEYNERFNELTSKANYLEEDIYETTLELNKQLDFIDLIYREGFLGSIFDEILNEISFETSKVLQRIPNVSNYTIEFESTKENSDGNIKSKIVPVLKNNGIETSLDLVSGGQASSIELITDLAVGGIIGRRVGNVPGWLLIDEAFDGLTNEDKESCFEILRQASKERLIILVDHSTEVKELFDDVVDIRFDGKFSSI